MRGQAGYGIIQKLLTVNELYSVISTLNLVFYRKNASGDCLRLNY